MQSEQSKKMYDLFLRLNIKLESITNRLRPTLTINESHIISEISGNPHLTAGELARILVLEKSTLSRALAALEHRKLIRTKASAEDRRKKDLLVTPSGLAALRDDSALRNRQVIECIADLASDEQAQLATLLRRLADNFGAAPIVPRADDHPVKIEIRRLTRSMGYLGDNFLDVHLPIEKCQILHAIARGGNHVPMAKLRAVLPYQFSALSRMLSTLSDNGWVNKNSAAHDRRSIEVALTGRGVDREREILDRASSRLGKAFHDLRGSEVSHMITLMERILPHYGPWHVGRPDGEEIRRLADDRARRMARGFIMETLVQSNRHFSAPEKIIASNTPAYALYTGGEICAVAEFRLEKHEWQLVLFIADAELDRTMQKSFLEKALALLREENPANAGQKVLIAGDAAIEIAPDCCCEPWVRKRLKPLALGTVH